MKKFIKNQNKIREIATNLDVLDELIDTKLGTVRITYEKDQLYFFSSINSRLHLVVTDQAKTKNELRRLEKTFFLHYRNMIESLDDIQQYLKLR